MRKFISSINFESRFFIFVAVLAYFILGLFTLPHYGINWDTINHSPRGLSYLHFFLTGKKDFSDLPRFQQYWQKEDSLFYKPDIDVPRVSLYHNAGVDFRYFVDNDGGHPPISDILSSLFNYILFQKLGVVNDIDSYRIYGVFLAAVTVGVVFLWVSHSAGRVAGIVSAFALGSYPLFWSEMHFNTEKDIPETAFWTLLLFSIWKGFQNKSWKWILISGIFFGLALGTKFNIVFIPFIVFPWVAYCAWKNNWVKSPSKFLSKNKKFLLACAIAPLVGLALFLALWPYLWADPIGRIQNVISFYTDIGLTDNKDERFIGPFGINTYPLTWIIYTTPIPTLILTVVGIIFSLAKLKEDKSGFFLLALIWLAVPIARVTWPGTTVYGGIRQIMEYLPPFAIFTGIGFTFLWKAIMKSINLARKPALGILPVLIVLALYAPTLTRLYRIHPHENVYFNELASGLHGAKQMDIPSWGNTFGAAYRNGAVWLNQNAERGAEVSYARELIPNIPRIWLRRDLSLFNQHRSGMLQEGEYVIALTYQGTDNFSYWDRYLSRMLIPVYEEQVDGVPILRIWKNSPEHLRLEYKQEKQINEFDTKREKNEIVIDLKKEVKLGRLVADYNSKECQNLKYAYVQVSTNGKDWDRLPGTMPKEDWSVPKYGEFPGKEPLLIPFADERARFVRIVSEPADSCILNIRNIHIFSF